MEVTALNLGVFTAQSDPVRFVRGKGSGVPTTTLAQHGRRGYDLETQRINGEEGGSKCQGPGAYPVSGSQEMKVFEQRHRLNELTKN